jgi:hypothetical protein
MSGEILTGRAAQRVARWMLDQYTSGYRSNLYDASYQVLCDWNRTVITLDTSWRKLPMPTPLEVRTRAIGVICGYFACYAHAAVEEELGKLLDQYDPRFKVGRSTSA